MTPSRVRLDKPARRIGGISRRALEPPKRFCSTTETSDCGLCFEPTKSAEWLRARGAGDRRAGAFVTAELPQVFSPGVISSAAHDTATAFTPDGRSIYFDRSSAAASFILVSRRTKADWSKTRRRPVLRPVARYGARYVAGWRCKQFRLRTDPPRRPPRRWTGRSTAWRSRKKPTFGASIASRVAGASRRDCRMSSTPARQPMRRASRLTATSTSCGRTRDVTLPDLHGQAHSARIWPAGPVAVQRWSEHRRRPRGRARPVLHCLRIKPPCRKDIDLFIAFRRREGWSEPTYLGDQINGPTSDAEPRLAPDHHTLYFSSERLSPVSQPSQRETPTGCSAT